MAYFGCISTQMTTKDMLRGDILADNLNLALAVHVIANSRLEMVNDAVRKLHK